MSLRNTDAKKSKAEIPLMSGSSPDAEFWWAIQDIFSRSRKPPRLVESFRDRGKSQERSGDGQSQERQVGHEMQDSGLKGILGEIDQERERYVLDSERTQYAPDSRSHHRGKTPDG